jgi:hypothetical protein
LSFVIHRAIVDQSEFVDVDGHLRVEDSAVTRSGRR